jgi:hypothetical protein
VKEFLRTVEITKTMTARVEAESADDAMSVYYCDLEWEVISDTWEEEGVVEIKEDDAPAPAREEEV